MDLFGCIVRAISISSACYLFLLFGINESLGANGFCCKDSINVSHFESRDVFCILCFHVKGNLRKGTFHCSKHEDCPKNGLIYVELIFVALGDHHYMNIELAPK